LAIDALLGIGAGRPPAGALRDAIRCLSTVTAPVLSVDLPSGLHPDSGALLGDSAVRARHTLCLLTAKPGLHTAAGRDHAGELWLDPLGIALPWPADAALTGADRAHRALPRRLHAHHKGSFGDVVVVGGAMGMTGAAYLAARAALSLGAGRTFVSPLDGSAAMDLARPELMVRPSTWALRPETLAKATVVCGCGGGEAVAQALPSVLHHAGRLVLDADGLNAVAADSSLQGLLRARAQRGLHTVATPHPLEAARLLNRSSADVQADRFAAATELSRRTGCTVILKGSGSIVATEDHLPLVNPTGNALLASAGTGDVLAGALGALWAVNSDADPHDVAAAGAWWHGHAADRAAASGQAAPLTASRLIDAMAAAMR
jgi:hydroxyethylthiazole kinase-like uncharacterized protein yjeF